jgi:hypothetical protein
MVDEIITTSVDSLLDLLKKVNKIEMEVAAKQLDVSLNVLQSWVEFLVEEKVLGIEYKFTTPFIYLNKPTETQTAKKESEEISIDNFKEDFHKKASEKKISPIQAQDLWKNHLLQKLEKKKSFFFKEARQRDFFNPEELWSTYRKKLMAL